MADSYGGARASHWGVSGPFWEAAALLGIPHIDMDALGGTGYAPNSVFGNPGDAFPERSATSVDAQPDLVITAGGINDNNSLALSPYATAADARAGFEAAATSHFSRLRAALPTSLLVALGPWAPRQNMPTHPTEQAKADTIAAALRAAGGPWVFLDNLNGGWLASSGASSVGSGPWQTGTGNSAAPAGNGNGDLYLAADGVHPNMAGSDYLGGRIAADLRSALATL
jgi:lysophospholipase L1-like esterase